MKLSVQLQQEIARCENRKKVNKFAKEIRDENISFDVLALKNLNSVYKKEYVKKIIEEDIIVGEYIKVSMNRIEDKLE